MLSIIIPVYNSEKYLSDCISSVLAQSYGDFELILVDDCSSDSSASICESFCKADARVKFIRHQQNRGISNTRYDGFMSSVGDCISFIDNDDLLVKDAYAVMMEGMGDDCQMSIVAAEVVDGDAVATRFAQLDGCRCGQSESMSGLAAYELLKSGKCSYGDIGGPWGKVYRRELVERTLAYTLQYREELPWSFFEDNLFIPVCFPLAEKVVLHRFTGYLHRGGGLSCNNRPTPYLYGCIGAGNVVLEFYRERGYGRLYELYVGQHLVYLESIFYRIGRFETDGEKREHYMPMVEAAFTRYCGDCLASPAASMSVKLSVFLFAKCRPLWYLLVGKMVLAKKYRRVPPDRGAAGQEPSGRMPVRLGEQN
ncbi:MAG: glycosyltransferase [Treponema sp.]|nr:glycosyltransferase [Treponema sp.]